VSDTSQYLNRVSSDKTQSEHNESAFGWLATEKACGGHFKTSSSRHLHRTRNLVERLFNKIKHCPRVATRYDKLAAKDLVFIQPASMQLWLRASESTA
jgi:transposase